ncbi:MAG: hypothetical protein HC883_00925 [Bdellovibrionaceae bacterium]|nr:hypothetical protein [Pseudobdellovibrionaceae bacterium]
MNEQAGLVVVFAYEDSVKVCDGSLLKDGVVVDDITIQVDKWDTGTREKYDDIKGRQR